jgi:pyruvate formate lyase activating enzyme
MTTPEQWTPAVLFEPTGDTITCTLCPHRCAMADGQAGLCRVRRRAGDRMQTATFGVSVSHVDPIERKPFYHFRPGTRAVTLAAPGCTFLCSYCINYRLSQYGRPSGDPWSGRLVDVTAVARQAAELGGSVALSYTEPALAIELTLALAEAGRPMGVDVVWKSNGFLTPAALAMVAPALAAVNVDVKAADEDRHRRLTGAPLAPVLDTIRELRARGVWVEVSTPLIPTVNADPAALAQIATTLARIDTAMPWHLLRFTPTFRMAEHRPTPPARLAEAVQIGRTAGLRHVYVERALGAAGRTTFCPACGAETVTRGIWSTEDNRLRHGACPACATPVQGRW